MNYYFVQTNNSKNQKPKTHKNLRRTTNMAVVKKPKKVENTTPTTKVVKKTTTVTPVKKAVEKATEAPVAEKKTAAKGGKKLSLTGNTKTPKSFEIREGTQATQEAFIDKFYKKMQDLGYDVTKEQVKKIKTAYSETLKEVTDIASYQDVDASIFYARRYIKPRVTEPPKAKDGLKTLMNGHYELKVRKTLGDEKDYKFFGDVNEDGTVFITTEGVEIPLNEEEEVEVKPVKKKTLVAKKKAAPVVEEEEVEEVVEDEEEIEEDVVDEEEDDDDEFDDFLDDEDEDE